MVLRGPGVVRFRASDSITHVVPGADCPVTHYRFWVTGTHPSAEIYSGVMIFDPPSVSLGSEGTTSGTSAPLPGDCAVVPFPDAASAITSSSTSAAICSDGTSPLAVRGPITS